MLVGAKWGGAAFAQRLFAGGGDKERPEEASACVANIGPRERRQRLVFGIVGLGAGILSTAGLIAFHADAWWRLLLFVPFSAGAAGYFQARDKT